MEIFFWTRVAGMICMLEVIVTGLNLHSAGYWIGAVDLVGQCTALLGGIFYHSGVFALQGSIGRQMQSRESVKRRNCWRMRVAVVAAAL